MVAGQEHSIVIAPLSPAEAAKRAADEKELDAGYRGDLQAENAIASSIKNSLGLENASIVLRSNEADFKDAGIIIKVGDSIEQATYIIDNHLINLRTAAGLSHADFGFSEGRRT